MTLTTIPVLKINRFVLNLGVCLLANISHQITPRTYASIQKTNQVWKTSPVLNLCSKQMLSIVLFHSVLRTSALEDRYSAENTKHQHTCLCYSVGCKDCCTETNLLTYTGVLTSLAAACRLCKCQQCIIYQ